MNVRELARFGVVGVAQNGLNLCTFALVLALGSPYLLAALAAFVVALVASFLMNRTWTFSSTATPMHQQFRRYATVFVLASLAGLALLTLFVESFGWRPVPSQAAAILVVAPLSYLAQRTFSFGAPRTRSPG